MSSLHPCPDVRSLNINKWLYGKWVWMILRFERRFFRSAKKPSTFENTTFEVVSYPSDLDERGCEINGKTRPVVPVTLPKPEKVK
jgi:hypothetical protein